ncbi:MAG: thiamine phosphate synthase [Acidaminococcales bacterium]|jgi:thiamine-phosphate pyrophosphorylase|nr:thiamine phosphate synthase [Acidaminococcales bacterium]
MKFFDLSLYLVTDSEGFTESEFLRKVEQALKSGVTLLQLREKNKSGREYYELARKVKKIADACRVPLLIDDRADIALAVDAAGVHLGADDLPVDKARALMGADKIIGATAKTVGAAAAAQAAGADYLGVGAIYPTATKVKTVLTGIDTLSAICRAVNIPAAAIGGLNAENIDVLRGSGAAGICVVSAIMRSSEPGAAVRALRARVEKILPPAHRRPFRPETYL